MDHVPQSPGALRNALTLKEKLSFAVRRGRGIHLETDLTPYMETLEGIRSHDVSGLSDRDLGRKADEYKAALHSGAGPADVLPQAIALVREACRRVLGQDAYDVQLLAGIVLSQGKLARMATGEGKTLAAAFGAVLSAWRYGSVHVMTANDYLARRDAGWMGGVYRLLGLSVHAVQGSMNPEDRKAAYRADIVYGTAKQIGFDYLSDGLRYRDEDRIQNDFASAIIDEADFILIDEARVPLVIASREEERAVDPLLIDRAVRALDPGEDFRLDRHGRTCTLTLSGQHRIEALLGCGGMHEESARETYCAVHAALHARYLLARDVDYIVRDGRIEQVDAFTGRIAERRRWPYGIQTALEAGEGLEIRNEGRVLGSITIQDLIGLYPVRSALTATALSAAGELYRCYGLATVLIPPNRPDRTMHLPDRVFTTREAKQEAVVKEIESVHRSGRPVLAGTSSVEESETLARALLAAGIECSVLNAKNDAEEAALIARAGMLHAVTISTSMAGRGTDIRLGGEEGIDRERVLGLGGLYVIGTTVHESVRIDNQLMGRAGRQGDPGTTRVFVSLEDDLVRRFAISELIPRRYLEDRTGSEITDRRVAREIARAQENIEAEHEIMRRTLRKYTGLAEKERRTVRTIREEALSGSIYPERLLELCGRRLDALEPAFGLEPVLELLTRVLLASLDAFWSNQLAVIDEMREGINLQWLGKEDPLLVFVKNADTAFVEGLTAAIEAAGARFLELAPAGLTALPDYRGERLTGPSSTWTYLVNDDPFPTFRLSVLAGSGSGTAILAGVQAAVLLPFLLGAGIRSWFRGNGRKRRNGKAAGAGERPEASGQGADSGGVSG